MDAKLNEREDIPFKLSSSLLSMLKLMHITEGIKISKSIYKKDYSKKIQFCINQLPLGNTSIKCSPNL